jgi:large subunit ribosomal protein L31
MQDNIHPKYHEVTFSCTCGHQFKVNSTITHTQEDGVYHIDICSHCHPFFTGQQKMIDTAGRIERFKERYRKKPDNKKKAA